MSQPPPSAPSMVLTSTASSLQPSGFLASPLGMALVIPTLILLTGIAVTWSTQAIMRQGALLQSNDAFMTQSQTTAEQTRTVLDQAAPVLDGLASWLDNRSGEQSDEKIALGLLSLVRGRPGVSQVYWATQAGVLRGVYFEANRWHYQVIGPGPTAQLRRVALESDGTLTQWEQSEPATFDPRDRPRYRAALIANRRVWTDPFVFVQGTPATMAPEQARAEDLDGRADLYALGCVAYWLLTGQQVFTADDPYSLVAEHINRQPVPPSRRASWAISPELDGVILGCLAKEREFRPANARLLAAALLAVPIPDDERWDVSRAQAWWRSHVPALPPVSFSKALDELPAADFTVMTKPA